MPKTPLFTRRRLLTNAAQAASVAAAAMLMPPNVQKLMAQPPRRPGTLKDIKHVVLLMQENRSFDHYFGMLSGVRGFGDPDAQMLSTGRTVFHQPDAASPDGYLLPFHLDSFSTNAQKLPSTSHAWAVQHQAWNGGRMDQWLPAHRAADGVNGPYTMGYFKREDIPFHYALAEAFTICDAYHCSVIGPTWPNRFYHMTGMIDPEGTGGGPVIENIMPPGGFRWKTYPERLQDAGIDWRIYQYGEMGKRPNNIFKYVARFRDAAAGSQLALRGLPDADENRFAHDVRHDRLPTVSWLMPSAVGCEHPDYMPAAGADFIARRLNELAANPDVWAKTVFILNYDENDGLFDHVAPPVPPAGTPHEFVGDVPIGAGFRVPCIIISPWTAGGWVSSQPFDHTSTLQFLERITGVREPNISDWRRRTFGDLTSVFRFHHPAAGPPVLPATDESLALARNNAATMPFPFVPGSGQQVPEQERGERKANPIIGGQGAATQHEEDEMNENPPGSDEPLSPERRLLLGGLAAAVGAAAIGDAGGASAPAAPAAKPVADAALRDAIDTVVVIYAENRSFNNLFGDFPGVEQPLSAVRPERYLQRDRDGSVLEQLPPIWEGLVPHRQVVEHREYLSDETVHAPRANAPFALTTPEGDPLPHGLVTRDLVHAFYNNQLQINGGRNDGFVAWGNSGALVMGYYADNAANLRLWQIAREFTLCDNFFMGAFGGSFLNHQYLIAAHPPYYPNADNSPAKGRITLLDESGPHGIRPRQTAQSPASAMDGPVRFVPNSLTPDFYAVNTMLPPYAPSYELDATRPGYTDWSSAKTLVPQRHDTIGDMLAARGVDWAWYAGGWGAALAGHGTDAEFPTRPNFQPHHQPLNYFARFAPGTAARDRHLRDGGLGETARTNKFLADVEAGRLPAVSYYKPQGNLNMHAGYSDVDAGDRHIAGVIQALRNSPQWEKMLVIVTFDENGGWWDHVAPPKGDRWGPGTRIPAIIVSPHAHRGEVDHTIYDTGSIARFLTRRFGLKKLPGLVEREQAMIAAGGPPPGDLTGALAFDG